MIEVKNKKNDVVWYSLKDNVFNMFGLMKTEKGFARMDVSTAESVSENVAELNYHTSGGRISFVSDTPYVMIKVKMPNCGSRALTLTAASGFDLYLDNGKEFVFYNSFIPPLDFENGYYSIIDFENEIFTENTAERNYQRKFLINFPLYSPVYEFYIGISKSASISRYNPYPDIAPIVFYGSSITQGASADHPGNCYASIVSRKLNRNYLNLGFSGSARGEIEMAEYISTLPMSLFFYGYDHNEVFFPEDFKIKHFRFYEIIRKKNPEIPIIFASAPFSPRAAGTFEITRKTVIESYNRAKCRGDNVFYIDGKKVFGKKYFDCGTVDGGHPSQYGFVKMADEVIKAVKQIENIL